MIFTLWHSDVAKVDLKQYIALLESIISRHYKLFWTLRWLKIQGAWGNVLTTIEEQLYKDTEEMMYLVAERYARPPVDIMFVDPDLLEEEARILHVEIERFKETHKQLE